MSEKLYIETVGCQMNVLDSELVVGSLRRQGFELTHQAENADVILFNTCSVRQHAEDKIYSQLGRLRGHKRRHPEHIIAEVKQLADEGCKEVTLLGQTVNSYKFARGDGRQERLADLLARIHDVAGIERLKFITNFPKDMSDDLLQAVRSLPKVCSYL